MSKAARNSKSRSADLVIIEIEYESLRESFHLYKLDFSVEMAQLHGESKKVQKILVKSASKEM